MKPEYVIERYKYGWLLKGVPPRDGIPMGALNECVGIMPKDAVVDSGISTALGGVFAIGTKEDCAKWRAEIEANLQKSNMHPELKWLHGTDTGLSSMCIFSSLAKLGHKSAVRDDVAKYAHLPQDSGDFGRCLRLVNRFMWKERLPELVIDRPEWSPIVGKWDELTALHTAGKHKEATDLIQQLNKQLHK